MLDQLLPFLRTGGPMGTAAPGTGLTNPVTWDTVDFPPGISDGNFSFHSLPGVLVGDEGDGVNSVGAGDDG